MPPTPQDQQALALYEKFQKLPRPIQDAMFSPQVAQSLSAIAQKHGVEGKAILLGNAVGDVFLGSLHPNLLIRTLTERLSIPQETARAVAIEISAQIFSKVRNDLLQLYQIQDGTSSAAPTASVRPLSGGGVPPPARAPKIPLQPLVAPPSAAPFPAATTPSGSSNVPPTTVVPPQPSAQRVTESAPVSRSAPPALRPTTPSSEPNVPMTPTQAALSGNMVNLRGSTNNQ